jgi:hypothetical protein
VTPTIRWIALALLPLFPCAATAEVLITPACRIPNQPPGRCGWCAVETLARHHRIRCLYGLTDDHATVSNPEDLEEVLIENGVPYRIQYPGYRDTAILDRAVERRLGAVVGFREIFPGHGGHIVTLTEFGPDEVHVIDPNDPDQRTRIMPRDRFLYWWDGFALVLEPKQTPRARTVARPKKPEPPPRAESE